MTNSTNSKLSQEETMKFFNTPQSPNENDDTCTATVPEVLQIIMCQTNSGLVMTSSVLTVSGAAAEKKMCEGGRRLEDKTTYGDQGLSGQRSVG